MFSSKIHLNEDVLININISLKRHFKTLCLCLFNLGVLTLMERCHHILLFLIYHSKYVTLSVFVIGPTVCDRFDSNFFVLALFCFFPLHTYFLFCVNFLFFLSENYTRKKRFYFVKLT